MRRVIISLLCIAILVSVLSACAQKSDPLYDTMQETADYLQKTVEEPFLSSVGGEWLVMGLARSGLEVPQEYYEKYLQNVCRYVSQCEGDLDDRKYTEYSRVVVALTALGEDPTNVAGYNLLAPLGDFEKTVWQGINGPIWALIALDSGAYEVPVRNDVPTQASRELYLEHILSKQLPEGGWTLAGSEGDADLTGMALQALAAYTDQPAVQEAVQRGLAWLSQAQDDEGGYSYMGVAASESVSQVMTALSVLGIPLEDERFVKNGNTLLDRLLDYRQENGSFAHDLSGSGENLMATEQAFYAMVSVYRMQQGMTGLYDMTDGKN